PAPPKAPLDAWRYEPHAAIVASVELADGRLGWREARTVAVLAPLGEAGVDLARAMPFDPEDLRHEPVAGARFLPLAGLGGARATKSAEKALKDRVLASTVGEVSSCPILDLLSARGQ